MGKLNCPADVHALDDKSLRLEYEAIDQEINEIDQRLHHLIFRRAELVAHFRDCLNSEKPLLNYAGRLQK